MNGKTKGLSYYSNRDGVFARERVPVTVTHTQDQEKVREFLRLATRNWDMLSESQRDAWAAYAGQYFPYGDSGRGGRVQGVAMYARSNITRQILGQGLLAEAPALAPPNPLTAIAPVVTDTPETFAFQLTHNHASVAGLAVLVRITPAMPTLGCTPQAAQARLIRGVDPASSAALPASGGTVTFANARYSVEDGQRYGVRAEVVRVADGIASPSAFADAIRLLA